ncbi:hypothetical protein [Paraburkholderia sp. BCC1884]|uniref:hypothetical protein n=1 Tax=Paraburkholderia sp. BCC1884 TaxID=2562668 RepID=UPI0021B283B9|nr:hypothetical protein [Paraburkholderia sp. BCC1884]
MQRHQDRIERNTDESGFARNAMFVDGLSSSAGSHIRDKAESSMPEFYLPTLGTRREFLKKSF